MSKPIASAEMKDWVNETWRKCQIQGETAMTDHEFECPRCGHCCPQPNQEPVGWFGYDTGVRAWFETNKGDDDSIPLYKAPRQWVGLTKEEAKEISLANRPYVIDMIAALEARLKEKNT